MGKKSQDDHKKSSQATPHDRVVEGEDKSAHKIDGTVNVRKGKRDVQYVIIDGEPVAVHEGSDVHIYLDELPDLRQPIALSNPITARIVRMVQLPEKDLQPEKPAYVDQAIERATAVLGGTDEALHWLGTPIAFLSYATPISLLGTKGGLTRVDDLLTQIEHGVW